MSDHLLGRARALQHPEQRFANPRLIIHNQHAVLLRLRGDERVRIAGQLSGVEGYVESIACGLLAIPVRLTNSYPCLFENPDRIR